MKKQKDKLTHKKINNGNWSNGNNGNITEVTEIFQFK